MAWNKPGSDGENHDPMGWVKKIRVRLISTRLLVKS